MVAAIASDHAVRGSTLTLREVSHRFDLEGQPLPVLDRISLQVGRGEFVALLGPSGCGKSTLLRLVAGLDTPTAGSLLTEGREIDAPDPSRVVVFQDPTLYPWRTVWSNVALGLEARGLLRTHRGRIEDALRLVGLTGFANAYPHQLSGGMAQRAALARALVNDPRLLIARGVVDVKFRGHRSLRALVKFLDLASRCRRSLYRFGSDRASQRCWSRTMSRRRSCSPAASLC